MLEILTYSTNKTQTTMTHIFRYDRYSYELIGQWVEDNDFTVPECKEYWLYGTEYIGKADGKRYRIDIIEDRGLYLKKIN